MSLEEFKAECKVSFRTFPRNRAIVHLVLKMPARLCLVTINKARLYVGFTRCLKCQDLGHIARHCRRDKETCSHCGKQDHKKSECSKEQEVHVSHINSEKRNV